MVATPTAALNLMLMSLPITQTAAMICEGQHGRFRGFQGAQGLYTHESLDMLSFVIQQYTVQARGSGGSVVGAHDTLALK
jgi:hypothetical protein